MNAFGQHIDLLALTLMWVLMGVTTLLGMAIGASWRELSLRKRWKTTEEEFSSQLTAQVSSRDAKILSLETQLSESQRAAAQLRESVETLVNREKAAFEAKLADLQPVASATAVVNMQDEEPQELVRHHSEESPEVI